MSMPSPICLRGREEKCGSQGGILSMCEASEPIAKAQHCGGLRSLQNQVLCPEGRAEVNCMQPFQWC